MRKRSNSEMAARFLRSLPYVSFEKSNIVREFARWLTEEQKKSVDPVIPAKIVVREGCMVQVGEHNGRVEVVFAKDGERIRLLGDKDGIHVGTIVKD